jgi:hypothetical protein
VTQRSRVAAVRELMGPSELAVIGLTCNLVGVFFLANSIIFRRPRKVIEEFFGVGVGSLTSIRDYALNKMQTVLGFLFLSAGFLAQALAQLDTLEDRFGTMLISVSIVAFAVLVYLVGLVLSRRSFKRYMTEFFRAHAWSFTQNMALTKEIGAFLGIRHLPDMSVEDYVREVKKALGVTGQETQGPAAGDRSRRIRDITPLPGR